MYSWMMIIIKPLLMLLISIHSHINEKEINFKYLRNSLTKAQRVWTLKHFAYRPHF